ncbi:MAG: tRNA pseudouridine(55) synthase [Deltaproteobacteria bacterium]|nr:tRNA pseudouridine(55) synthase [Deltaproteobacteria bacterium]
MRPADLRPGIHLLHKPVGATSFSLVQPALDALAARPGKRLPVCHGGTLDPFAEGLLLLLVGPTTKLMDLLHAAPKVYVADLAWGAETDNGDPTGTEVAQGVRPPPSDAELEAALRPFLGWTDQVPPATSAKKLGGEPAYKKAHRGEAVILPPSRVFLHAARVLDAPAPGITRIELTCRGGYYVRSFARDLGRALGCRAHLVALHRTVIGPWRDPGPSASTGFATGPDALPWARRRVLTDQEVGRLRAGEPIPAGSLQPGTWSFPAGFPDAAAPVLGVHLGRLAMLLKEGVGGFALHAELRGGL